MSYYNSDSDEDRDFFEGPWNKDKEFVIDSVKLGGETIRFTKKFRNDKEVVLASLNNCNLSILNDRFCCGIHIDKEIALKAVKIYGLSLEFVSKELQDDLDVVLEAVKQTPNSIEYVSEKLQKNELVLFTLITTSISPYPPELPHHPLLQIKLKWWKL